MKRKSEDSDLWDDEALIKAYDKAVKAVKDEIQAENNGEPSQEAESSSQNKSKSQEKKKFTSNSAKKSRRRKKKSKWNVGDHCRAIYSEDGLIYDCVIQSIDAAKGTCLVKYTDYGNEEDIELTELLLPETASTTAQTSFPRQNAYDSQSMEWSDHGQSPVYPGPRQPHYHGNPSRMRYPPFPPSSVPRASPHFHAMHPFNNPYFHPFPYGYPTNPWQSGVYPGTPPRIPPVPPPPAITHDALDGDEDALFSMLISWYMSGYHTGYYQGMKAARHGDSSQQNTPQRDTGQSPWRPPSSQRHNQPSTQDLSNNPRTDAR
ncbi:survival motor neuron protein 1-like isoform X2 [Ptychodera flava]|uniref:survival motor neuron protein 1-like isoform X2 n=1 Tax=Ptychodera flava TaxID=63121 RepID=UPI00396A3197